MSLSVACSYAKSKVSKGFSSEPSPVSSEPVVATCIVVAKEKDENSISSKYLKWFIIVSAIKSTLDVLFDETL